MSHYLDGGGREPPGHWFDVDLGGDRPPEPKIPTRLLKTQALVHLHKQPDQQSFGFYSSSRNHTIAELVTALQKGLPLGTDYLKAATEPMREKLQEEYETAKQRLVATLEQIPDQGTPISCACGHVHVTVRSLIAEIRADSEHGQEYVVLQAASSETIRRFKEAAKPKRRWFQLW